jgi:hypothetical protein
MATLRLDVRPYWMPMRSIWQSEATILTIATKGGPPSGACHGNAGDPQVLTPEQQQQFKTMQGHMMREVAGGSTTAGLSRRPDGDTGELACRLPCVMGRHPSGNGRTLPGSLKGRQS